MKPIAKGLPVECDWSMADHVTSLVVSEQEKKKLQRDLQKELRNTRLQRDLLIVALAAALIVNFIIGQLLIATI